MRLSAALAALEEVLLDVVEDIKPGAAGRVADGLAVGAGGALLLDHGGCMSQMSPSVLRRTRQPVQERTLSDRERKCDGNRCEELLEGHCR